MASGRNRNRVQGLWLGLLVLAAPGAALLAAGPHASPAQVTRGQQLATVLGCRSCHTPTLAGKPMVDDPTIGTLYSANLTRAVPRYDDRALERVIRTGIRPDGSHLWFMAAAPYAVLDRSDMRDLIAYLRSVPATGEERPRLKMGPRFLRAVKAGRLRPEGLDLADALAHPAPDLGPQFARGRYLARTACGGCHMPALTGVKDRQPGEAPDLAVAAAYDRDRFRTLMRTGQGLGGRDLGDMKDAARERFAGLPDTDIDAIRDYLVARSRAPH